MGLPGPKPSEITGLVSIGFSWTPRQRGILVLKFTITEAKTNYTFQLFFPARKHIANKWQSTWGGRLGRSEPANEPVPTCCRGTIKQSARARGGFKSLRTRLFRKALRQTGMSRIFCPSFTFSRELPGKKVSATRKGGQWAEAEPHFSWGFWRVWVCLFIKQGFEDQNGLGEVNCSCFFGSFPAGTPAELHAHSVQWVLLGELCHPHGAWSSQFPHRPQTACLKWIYEGCSGWAGSKFAPKPMCCCVPPLAGQSWCSGELDLVIPRGFFQPLWFCDSLCGEIWKRKHSRNSDKSQLPIYI